ncbi:MAG: MBL fold metallo-hydrolase [Bacteroidetes bacterium]|nr:MBL fold metallo-hydrolase [Bacteroidota bacterium]MBS1609200.1 MBL fold metallo-hydrolase [Bacteroidota bacterium]
MLRRNFIRSSALSIGALSLSQQKILTSLFEDPWKITMLKNDIGIFTEKGGTIAFMLAKDGIVTVDAQFPEQAQHYIDEMKKRGGYPFKLLINTHHHGDHSSGNIAFKGLVERVLAHENSLKNQKRVAEMNKTEDKQLYPADTFGSEWHEKDSKEKISLYYYGAAHTDGDAIIHFGHSNIVHMGDLVFNRIHPYVDRSAGANVKSWMDVLDKTLRKFDKKTTYVFGHAAQGYEVTGTRDDVKAFRDYLEQVYNFVEAQVKKGISQEDLIKIKALPFDTEWKGDGLDRPFKAIYEELTMYK